MNHSLGNVGTCYIHEYTIFINIIIYNIFYILYNIFCNISINEYLYSIYIIGTEEKTHINELTYCISHYSIMHSYNI